MRTIAAVAVICVCGGIAAAQPTAGSDPLHAAAQARQARYERVRIGFKLRETWEPGSVTENNKRMNPTMLEVAEKEQGAAPGSSKALFPKEATTLESACRLSLSKDSSRYENNYSVWGINRAIDFETIATTNAEKSKYYSKSEPKTSIGSGGTIYKDRGYIEVNSDQKLYPLLYFMRGASKSFADVPLSKYTPTGKTRLVGESRFLEYTASLSTRTYYLWIDPTKEDNVVGIERHLSGKLEFHFKIDYAIANGHWQPTKWISSHFLNGKLSHTKSVEVTEFLHNATLNDSDFDIVFPPGCGVYDAAVSASYTVNSAGDLKPDNPAHGDAIPQSESWFRRHLWSLIAAVLALVALGILIRFRRNRYRTTFQGV